MGSKQFLAATLCVLALAGTTGCSSSSQPAENSSSHGPVRNLKTEIVATHPYDPHLFTQGIEVDGQDLLIGTGWYGESKIVRVPLADPAGRPSVEKHLPTNQFGEGIAQVGAHVWQLTWKEGIAYKRDARTLEETAQARYPGQGWGLCAAGNQLFMSDGSASLRVLNPETFAEAKRITVRDSRGTVDRLNELECHGGKIYANRFMTNEIVEIGPDGWVSAHIDASALPNRATPDPNHVLNGIAALEGTDRFLLTGKRWPDMYEVRFVPAD
ncbi:glutaminyl-peptide cyclotransferase [Staphylococcus chromogenes]|nr:glutaminyl-peptide cyclotransferase [Staphylococcus chromogenes]